MEHASVESKISKDSSKQNVDLQDRQQAAPTSSVHRILELQRTIGNRPVARLIHTKLDRIPDPTTGNLLGAGDEAEAQALKAPLQIDTVSVQTDRSRVGELIADIDKQVTNLGLAEKQNSDLESKFAPVATNTATRALLSVLDDKLDVSAVDTTAFAAQYRVAFADYHRLTAEATEALSVVGAHSDDPLGAVGTAFGNTPGLKMGAGQAGLERFRAARTNLNTAGKKMEGQLTAARGAANLLQGAVNKAKAAAAKANGADAATKLAAVRAEIDQVASGVGKVVKICSAVAGLAGGGGATNALAIPKEAGGSVDIDPSISGLRPGATVSTPEDPSKAAILKAMGTDAASVLGDGGGPDKMAESLVKAIGEYANKDKIANLQQLIIKAAAEETTFNAAGDAQNMVGYQDQMDAAAKQLSLLIQTFASAKQELAEASQALMEELNKGGKKGKDQAKGVLFLTDADRFLAQVENAISVGKNQQENLKQAASDRKTLRGTTAAVEGGQDSQSQYYFRCTKTTVPGKIYGTNDLFKLDKVFVTFQDSGGFGQNDINQGGAGTVEGTGSASDEVAKKIDVLTKAKDQVTVLQTKVQGALGLGGPKLNA